uniref:Hypothetical bHLH family protein n=1 Tax=Ipomoea batatas TaxID=4120 RepID=Q5MG91_IPOBA|nr:hypothetical bHLH family protein [Ipomoea batatas]
MSSRRSRSRQPETSRISDDQIADLVSKLQRLIPEIRGRRSDKAIDLNSNSTTSEAHTIRILVIVPPQLHPATASRIDIPRTTLLRLVEFPIPVAPTPRSDKASGRMIKLVSNHKVPRLTVYWAFWIGLINYRQFSGDRWTVEVVALVVRRSPGNIWEKRNTEIQTGWRMRNLICPNPPDAHAYRLQENYVKNYLNAHI